MAQAPGTAMRVAAQLGALSCRRMRMWLGARSRPFRLAHRQVGSGITRAPAKGAAAVATLSAGLLAAQLATPGGTSGSKCAQSEEPDRMKRWLEKWEKHDTAWHRKDVNMALEQFFRDLVPESMRPSAPMGPRVLVPLCGKAVDMAWLARRGIGVLGIEGARQAVDEFAEEHSVMGHSVAITIPGIDAENFRGHAALLGVGEEGGTRGTPPPPVIFVEGDFFKLTPEDIRALVPCDAAFDRGSLVAVDPALRERYVGILSELIVPGGRVLLVAVEHGGKSGPPFEVLEQDVSSLFGSKFAVKQLARWDNPEVAKSRGVAKFADVVYLLTKLPAP